MDSEITLKMNGYTSTCTIPEEESTSNEVLTCFTGMMISQGFSVRQVKEALDQVLGYYLPE